MGVFIIIPFFFNSNIKISIIINLFFKYINKLNVIL